MITIRPIADSDAEAVGPLLAQLGYPADPHALPGRVAAIVRDRGVVLVAEDGDGRIVGVTSGARHATIHNDRDVAYITALVTDERARGQGVGRALVNAIETWARELGCSKLSVTSAEHRADAHQFYPRIGFPYNGRRFSKSLSS